MPPRPAITRRSLLTASLAMSALGWGLRSRAAGPEGRRFVFVLANGGWDTTRVFSPMLRSPRITAEPGAAEVRGDGVPWVDHPDRPAVRAFFTPMASRVAVVDGLLIRSINHRVCVRLIQTGSSDPTAPDWASILGGAGAADGALPAVVLDGPSQPGPFQQTTSTLGRPDAFGALLDGTAYDRGDVEVSRLYAGARARIDELVLANAERALARATDPGWRRVAQAEVDALGRASQLAAAAPGLTLRGGPLLTQVDTAVSLLGAGVSRCACLSIGNFDTHGDNRGQGPLYEELFTALSHLEERLQATPGPSSARLADETVVVVLSEMGRTPYLNDTGGTDHWPYTAAMLWGAGVRGGVRIGSYDDFLIGQPVDLDRGGAGATTLLPGHLGATLLTLGGLDPAAWVTERPIRAVLAG